MFFCEKYNSIPDAEFGFRKGKSTEDAIFALNAIAEHFLNYDKRLHVAFIDLKKCFDSIYRNAMCLKLFKHGMHGKVLRIVKHIYDDVKSCAKLVDNYSDFFWYSAGLTH